MTPPSVNEQTPLADEQRDALGSMLERAWWRKRTAWRDVVLEFGICFDSAWCVEGGRVFLKSMSMQEPM